MLNKFLRKTIHGHQPILCLENRENHENLEKIEKITIFLKPRGR